MQHLKILSILNYVSAAIMALCILLDVGLFGGLFAMDKVAPGEEILVGVVAVMTALLLLVLTVLYAVAGRKSSQGQGRILLSVLAALNICSCPGFLFAGYAIWLCWINPETKQIFEQGGI